jgi:hypothetical protein
VTDNGAKAEQDKDEGSPAEGKQPENRDTPPNQSPSSQSQPKPGSAGNGKSKFDWVTERSSCSLPKVFGALRTQVEDDVKTRNALRPSNSPYEFSVAEDVSEFTVLLKTAEASRSVVFNLTEHAIVIRDQQRNPMFEVAASLNDQGECRLKVNGEERDFWQVRRLALEDLMFHGS